MRFLLSLFVFILLGCAKIDGNAQTINPIYIPSYSVIKGEEVMYEEVISEKCKKEVLSTFPHSIILQSVETRSEEGYFIWRSDIKAVNGRLGRVICWSPLAGMQEKLMLNSKFLDSSDQPLPPNKPF